MNPLPVTMNRSTKSADSLYVGLDVGGTKVEAMVVGEDATIYGHSVHPTNTNQPDYVVDSIIHTLHMALAEARLPLHKIQRIGIGIPGQVDPLTGIVDHAVNLNLHHYPLGQMISDKLNIPCFIENDMSIGVLGAYAYLRQYQPIRSVAYLSIGTGVASGLILDGSLYRGAHGMSGEIGHVVVEPNGLVCKCGQRGCLETIVSGPAITRQLPELQAKTPHEVYQAAQEGYQPAQAVVERVSWYLAQAVQWLLMAYDVERIVISGGVTRMGSLFLEPVRVKLAELRATSELASFMLADEKIVQLPSDWHVGAWGAVLLAQQAPLNGRLVSSTTKR